MADCTIQQSHGGYAEGQESAGENWCVTVAAEYPRKSSYRIVDLVISTPLRLVASLKAGHLELGKYVLKVQSRRPY